MYLLYDVIQLRKSSIGNAFLIKRQNWQSVTKDITCLTICQLQNAAKSVARGQKIEDPIIRRLLRNIVTIGMQVPGSFAQKLRLRSEIRGLITRYGMPAFWITINPSDLRNPLVLILAGVEYSGDSLATANAAIREAAATSNPAVVAEFFHHVCKAVLEGLFATNTDQVGILGELSNHFAVVETNGRGMLHLHGLAWARGNLAFTTLRDRLLQDTNFAARMLHYLESIIIQGIDESIPHDTEVSIPSTAPSTKDFESDDDFRLRLSHDSNYVAHKTQVHSKRHLATCFKYRKTGPGKNTCRFGMPRDLVPVSKVDDFGLINLARNHAWINPWNPAIASCVRSNHDISWIPTVSKSLSLIYYITNYATKDDVSPWQMLAKAALLKESIEKAKVAEQPTATDLRLRKKGVNNFALRCFNALSHDREISGVQVASILLQLPTYYTINYNFVRINLWWLRRYIRAIIRPDRPQRSSSSDPIAEEPCTYETGDTTPVSIFDNYKWRGPHLAPLALFEYCMLIKIKHVRDAIADDVDFDPNHPRYATHVQCLPRTLSQVATVTFSGHLTEFQAAEDAAPGGHPKTTAIMNDVAEILLGLFIPWGQLIELFRPHPTKTDAFVQIWAAVEPTLAFHNRAFARNIELLRKSKEDCQADAKMWKSANGAADSFHDAEEYEPACSGSDSEETEELLHLQDQDFNAGTLIAAYHSISKAWYRETLVAGRRIPPLLRAIDRTRSLSLQNLQPLDIFNAAIYESSGLKFLPPFTLQEWELQLKCCANPSPEETTDGDTRTFGFVFDDFDIHIEDGILHPTLFNSDMIPAADDLQSRVGQNPTGASLASLITQEVPLNRKQRMVVERVLSEALAWVDHPYDSSQRKQTLLYVGGEGGTGKSQIIQAIVAGMNLIRRKDEVVLMAPTGAAADVIGGNTYYTSLGISIDRSRETRMKSRVRWLWSHKTIMIVDEVSMMDLHMINVIDNQCKIARALDRSCPDLFGGLPVVIFIGDFFQFPPVLGPPLWREARRGINEDENGRLLWHQFKEVIILDEQMRHAEEDTSFRDLLSRARTGALTEIDRSFLNSKTVTSLVSPQLADVTTVVKLNSLRHQVNRVRLEEFARNRCQNIYIFPALHKRTKSTGSMNLRLHADDLLQQPDQGTKIPFPGLFLYTRNMPAVILTNICTPLGLVNGASGVAIGIVVDATGGFIFLKKQ